MNTTTERRLKRRKPAKIESSIDESLAGLSSCMKKIAYDIDKLKTNRRHGVKKIIKRAHKHRRRLNKNKEQKVHKRRHQCNKNQYTHARTQKE